MDDLLKELPRIGRMRFWRLYGRDGSRFLDLRFLDGAGFLGAKGVKALTWAKNALDRGLVKAAPDAYQERLERSLAKRFGEGAKAFLFRDCERALLAAQAALGRDLLRESLYDPALRSTVSPAGAPGAVDRPFLDEAQVQAVATAPLILVPPALSAPLGCAALVSRDAALSARLHGDTLEGISTFPSARAFDDRALMAREYTAALYRKADKRLAPRFERRGPYLYARVADDSAYANFRRKALSGGVLLSQSHAEPSILPLDFDDGELAKLMKALEA